MQRRAVAVGLGLLAITSCAPKRPAPPPAPPQLTSASELLPPDLDVVVRLDLGRMKAALGAAALSTLAGEVLSRGGAKQGADELLVASLLEADVVYLAYRPSSRGAPLDRVLSLEGHFTQLMRTPNGFEPGSDLGGDWRYWDAAAPPPREGVARLYVLGNRFRAFVSEAEIDAVERLLARGAEHRLEPAAEGTFSLALRPRILAERVGSGRLRELFADATELRAVVQLDSDRVRIKAELLLDGDAQAEELVRAGREVAARLLGDRAEPLELRADGSRAVLSLELGRSELAPLLGCFQNGAGACPW